MDENLITAELVEELAGSVKLEPVLVRRSDTNELAVVSGRIFTGSAEKYQRCEFELIIAQPDLELLAGGEELENLSAFQLAELARCLNENDHPNDEEHHHSAD